mgnify:CR=1 FL=1
MSNSGAGAMLRAIERNIKSAPRWFVEYHAEEIAKVATEAVTRDTGGDRVLSGTTKRGNVGRLRVERRVQGDQAATAQIKPGPTGRTIAIWCWLQWGTVHTRPKETWTAAVDPALEFYRRRLLETIRHYVTKD